MSENTSNTSFFYLLDNCHPLIKKLALSIFEKRKPKREWFSDDINYYYYMFYVRPKLTASDGYCYAFGNEIYKNHYKIIMISSNYIGISIKVEIKNHYYTDYRYHEYVIGVDNLSRKLFVNKVGNMHLDTNNMMIYKYFGIIFTTDKTFWDIFGYNHDVDDGNNTVIIDNVGTYRVQGEVVLTVIKETDIAERVIGNFWADIVAYIRTLAIDRLLGVLIEIGYSPEIVKEDRHIELRVFMEINEKQFNKFVNNVVKALEKYFSEVKANGECIKCNTIDLGEITFCVKQSIAGDYISITVIYPYFFGERQNCPIAAKLENELIKAFQNLPKSNFEFFVGEHRIKIKNAYSLRMTYVPEIQPIFINLVDVNSYENSFIVFHESTIEIEHREHGKKSIKFNDTYMISFTTTNIDNLFIRERNKVVNYVLSKSLAKNKP
jgi:hypothetical protein